MKTIVLTLFIGVSMVLGMRPAYAETATAEMAGTAKGSTLSGQVTLEETPKGLKITADLSRVPPGTHGFHIHEHGSCEDVGKAAGDHFNPDGASHGNLMTDGMAHAHAGDLGNIEIAKDGTGRLEATLPGLSLRAGRYGVAGRALILHEKADDFGQPLGNAGARIGCGIIHIEGAGTPADEASGNEKTENA